MKTMSIFTALPGLVAHSILFKRMIQLFWPKDRLRQERRFPNQLVETLAASRQPTGWKWA